jgi:DNA ligase (NAD+)
MQVQVQDLGKFLVSWSNNYYNFNEESVDVLIDEIPEENRKQLIEFLRENISTEVDSFDSIENAILLGSMLSDAEYDLLHDLLKLYDPTNSIFSNVGASPSFGKKVKHPSLMGSLDKVNEFEDLQAWFSKYKNVDSVLIASPKVDGLAVRLRYEKGELVESATRGDGSIGQDVLDNVKQIRSIPQKLKSDFTGEVRGEVYMRKDVWEELGLFANPRNGAAGGLLQKDPNNTKERKLDFLAYKCFDSKNTWKTELEQREAGSALGFDYVPFELVEFDHLEAFLLQWSNVKRKQLPYQIDGLVFSLNSIEEQEEAGWNGKRPLGKMAWKFKPEQKESNVLGVTWQIGRTGKLTPVLQIEPTQIDGSTVSNVCLHSLKMFEELSLSVNDKVLIEKAGDIIPQVVRVTWRSMSGEKLIKPERCEFCDSVLASKGAHLFCNLETCSSRLELRIRHWFKTIDIKGAGVKIISEMCKQNIVKDLVDLYYLQPEKLELATGSQIIAKNIIQELAEKSVIPLWRFLAGLGIPSLGETASKSIAKNYGELERIKVLTAQELLNLDGFGETTTMQIVAGLKAMHDEIKELEKVLEIELPISNGCLSGKSFCLTGTMTRGRKEIEEDIEANGGEVKKSVGKGLDYLVMSDPNSTSSKAQKARKLGTQVISEDELNKMIG